MKLYSSAILLLSLLAAPSFVHASDQITGDYLCTIVEKAGISSWHGEGSEPPKTYISNLLPTRFTMRILLDESSGAQYKMIETNYDGPDRDPREWHTDNSILHLAYFGDGIQFTAVEGQAFVRFHRTVHKNDDGEFGFYHAGFEWAGGEDNHLSVRWGRCKLID